MWKRMQQGKKFRNVLEFDFKFKPIVLGIVHVSDVLSVMCKFQVA